MSAGDYTFRATGSVQKFDGYLAVYQVPRTKKRGCRSGCGKPHLPQVTRRRDVASGNVRPDQHFTEPPPRYTEATLVKELEEKGIGRPSTYASIISTIVEREYVTKDQGRFAPTMLGEKVSDLLVKSFEEFSTWASRRAWKRNSTKSKKAKCPGGNPSRNSGTLRVGPRERPKTKWSRTRRAFPPGKNARSAAQGELLERISRHGFFLGCYALSRLRFHPGSFRAGRRGETAKRQTEILRQLRQGNGGQARPIRSVPGLHRLSGLQDDAAAGERHAQGAAAGRTAR